VPWASRVRPRGYSWIRKPQRERKTIAESLRGELFARADLPRKEKDRVLALVASGMKRVRVAQEIGSSTETFQAEGEEDKRGGKGSCSSRYERSWQR
jgi:hypothetical protein